MPRQRFIWPSIWEDPDLGRLTSDARLLYIGCFSLADDDGRLIGDPTYLKTSVFRYTPHTPDEVRQLRDQLAHTCSQYSVYTANGIEYIAFRNWTEFQKPKYPTASKLPAPPWHKKRRNARKQAKNVPGMIPGTVPGTTSGTIPGEAPGTVPGTIPPRVGLGFKDLKDPSPSSVLQDAGTDGRTALDLENTLRSIDP